MKKKPVGIAAALAVSLSALAVILRQVVGQLNGRWLLLISGLAATLCFGLMVYLWFQHRGWVERRFPWICLPYAGAGLTTMLCGSLAAAGVGAAGICFPTGNLRVSVVDGKGNPLADVLVLLWDPKHASRIGDARQTEATGSVIFEHVGFGTKKVYLLRQLPDHSWRMMYVKVEVGQFESDCHLRFKARKANPEQLTTFHFAISESEIAMVERLTLEGERAHLAGENGRILILGNTDQFGSDRYNDGLGARRATAAMALLQQLGFDPKDLRGFSFGRRWQRPADFAYANRDQIRQINRRVELLFVPLSSDLTD